MAWSTLTARRVSGVRRSRDRAPAGIRLGTHVGVLVAAVSGLDLVLQRATWLPEASFEAPVLVAELLRQLATPRPAQLLLTGFLVGLVGAGLWRRSLGPAWEELEAGRRLRLLALVVAGLLAWTSATYGYNAYVGRLHLVDRLLLVALLPLVAWRPAFLWAFLLALMPVLWQVHVPIGGASWAEPILLVRVLLVLGAGYLLRSVMPRLRGADVVFVVCCLIAAHYWVSGVGKLRLDGWILHDQLAYLLPATYANGWLGFLEPETIDRLTRGLAGFNGPLKAFTLVAECGAVLAVARRGVLRALLIGWIALHGGIFLTTGICFWRWMLLDAAVFALFAASRSGPLPIFTRPHLVLSVVLIGGGAVWFRPVELAWHDARISYTYRLHAVTADGARYVLPPRFFEPYAYQFTLSGFGYLSAAPRLPVTWGATRHAAVGRELGAAATPEAVWAVERAHGRVGHHPERAARFDAFLRRFVPARLARPPSAWWTYLQAPPLLWTFPYRPSLPPASAERVVVTQVTSFFDGRRYREIRAVPVRVVELQPTVARRTP